MSIKILAIQFKFLGDAALSVPALRAIREKYPDGELHVLANASARPILEHIPWIDKVWALNKKSGLKKTLALLSMLRKERFDTSIDFVGNDRGALFSLVIGAKTRLGPIAPKGFLGRKFCYNRRIPEPDNIPHAIDRNLHLLSHIGIPSPKNSEPELYADPGLKDFAKKALPENAIFSQLTTSCHSKEWPVENWITFYKSSPELAQRLVFAAGVSERESEILAKLKAACPDAHCLPPTTIPELMALVEHATAVITGDTFTSHAAAGLHTPVVVLFGPTQAIHWDPRGARAIIEAPNCQCQHFFYTCFQPEKHCMKRISPDSVKTKLLELIS